jgi:metal-responsive CopG/Arc/MetJ family transcriptional regulator
MGIHQVSIEVFVGAKVLKAINIDLPEWMVAELDAEAEKLGINRKAVINVLLASVLEECRRLRLTSVGYPDQCDD